MGAEGTSDPAHRNSAHRRQVVGRANRGHAEHEAVDSKHREFIAHLALVANVASMGVGGDALPLDSKQGVPFYRRWLHWRSTRCKKESVKPIGKFVLATCMPAIPILAAGPTAPKPEQPSLVLAGMGAAARVKARSGDAAPLPAVVLTAINVVATFRRKLPCHISGSGHGQLPDRYGRTVAPLPARDPARLGHARHDPAQQ